MEGKTLWAARDKNGDLFMYDRVPKRYDDSFDLEYHGPVLFWRPNLGPDLFSDLRWEDDPIPVRLKLEKVEG